MAGLAFQPDRAPVRLDDALHQRQADADATFMWDFAQVGTKVVVL